jgi:hypothetical protein
LSGETKESARPLTRYDHCLVRVEWRDQRNDYTSLPFHASWNKARDLVWEGQGEKARSAFLELVRQVAGSPDLTARHRAALMSVYRANFEAEIDSYRSMVSGLPPTEERAAGADIGGPRETLQTEALTLHHARLDKESQAMIQIADGLPRISQARANAPLLTDAVLIAQMNVIGTPAADPQQLADAMVVAAFRNLG